MIRPPGGGLEFGDSSGLPKLCPSPRDPCAHRSKSKEAERTRWQGCHSMEGCSRIWGALVQFPFLGPCSWFLLGDFKSGQLELGRARAFLVLSSESLLSL